MATALQFTVWIAGIYAVTVAVVGRCGWYRLARCWRIDRRYRPQQLLFRFGSLSINGLNYNRCIRIGVSPEGLYLAPIFLLPAVLLHPPLLIPWGEIRSESVKRWFIHCDRLSFQSRPNIRVDVPAKVWRQVTEEVELMARRLATDPTQP